MVRPLGVGLLVQLCVVCLSVRLSVGLCICLSVCACVCVYGTRTIAYNGSSHSMGRNHLLTAAAAARRGLCILS